MLVEEMTMLCRLADLPFLATDRSVLNLPGAWAACVPRSRARRKSKPNRIGVFIIG